MVVLLVPLPVLSAAQCPTGVSSAGSLAPGFSPGVFLLPWLHVIPERGTLEQKSDLMSVSHLGVAFLRDSQPWVPLH